MTSSGKPHRLVPDRLLTEINAADAAAQAARAVPGVIRLQPGVLGLLRQFAAQAWELATGKGLPDIAGVQADLSRDAQLLRIEVRIVVSVHHQAAHVGATVHDAVAAAVLAATDTAARVRVHIVEIDLEPQPTRH